MDHFGANQAKMDHFVTNLGKMDHFGANIGKMNIALLTRWIRHIANVEGGLSLTIIQNKYFRGQPLALCQRSGGSQFW